MRENFEWFIEHYNEIFGLCGECHVVIFEKKLVGVFNSFDEAHTWVNNHNLFGRCNVQYCNGKKTGYTAYIN